jgi:hypothetical protein
MIFWRDSIEIKLLGNAFFAKWAGGTLVRVDGPDAALRALKVIDEQS